MENMASSEDEDDEDSEVLNESSGEISSVFSSSPSSELPSLPSPDVEIQGGQSSSPEMVDIHKTQHFVRRSERKTEAMLIKEQTEEMEARLFSTDDSNRPRKWRLDFSLR